jgi:hypothetical protein
LPDWRKIELKLTQSKFNNYPVQTIEQESTRRDAVLQICAYFAMVNFDEFVDTLHQNTFDGIWPLAMELFITPRLLDQGVTPYKQLLAFGKCYCCEHFKGYNNTYQPVLGKKNIIPLYGVCSKTRIKKKYSRILSRVRPDQRCVSWNPMRIYQQAINARIKNLFDEKYTDYSYNDYLMDLKTIDIWDFFQNRYKLKS